MFLFKRFNCLYFWIHLFAWPLSCVTVLQTLSPRFKDTQMFVFSRYPLRSIVLLDTCPPPPSHSASFSKLRLGVALTACIHSCSQDETLEGKGNNFRCCPVAEFRLYACRLMCSEWPERLWAGLFVARLVQVSSNDWLWTACLLM